MTGYHNVNGTQYTVVRVHQVSRLAVKLVTAVSLWIGPAVFLEFLLIMALCGGVVAILQTTQWRLGLAQFLTDRGETGMARTLIGRDIPYAIAIVPATIAVMPVPGIAHMVMG